MARGGGDCGSKVWLKVGGAGGGVMALSRPVA